MINYDIILNKNLLNVLKEVLIQIQNNKSTNHNQLYITFNTQDKNVIIPKWLLAKYPRNITIVLQHEFYNLKVSKEYFNVTLSFDDIKTDLKISFSSIISFADPTADFGLILQKDNKQKKINTNLENKKMKKDNVINFSNYKKN